jgi:hypothetical protein
MITEDYVSLEIAKLLREKGFSEWCSKCYGVAVLHNGADIDFDEECELKDEGREDEIEYVEGGMLYDYGCNNLNKDDAKVWAAPTLWVAMKWLREVHHIFIRVIQSHIEYCACEIYYNRAAHYEFRTSFDSYEEACEAAIKYCLENLI